MRGARIRLKSISMKDKKFLILSALFFFLFAAAMISLSLQPNRIFQARATVPSPSKSFVIAHYPPGGIVPLNEKIKVTVYIRDEDGNVLANRGVRLSNTLTGVTILPSDTITTNQNGMAEFSLSSVTNGKAQISAVDQGSNTSLTTSPGIQFGQ